MAERDTVFFDAAEALGRRFVAVEVGRVVAIPEDELARETPSLTELAEKAAPDPSVFTTYKPWFWRMTASTDRQDSYGTKMMPSSLRNYAADYTEGRAFLIGHDKRAIPTGYSLLGRYIAGQGGGIPRTDTDLYALTGLPRVDDAVISMKGGTLRDASISFSGGRWICSIDGADMLRATWDECWHFPGMWYRKEGSDKKGKKGSEDLVQCVAFVEDAHAHEVSGVYDGATPGAGMVKALRAAEAGLLSAPVRQAVESQYRMALPGERLYLPAGMEGRMGDRSAETTTDDAAATRAAGEGTTTPPTVPTDGATTQATTAATVVVEQRSDAGVIEACRLLGIDPGSDAPAALRSFAGTLPALRQEAEAGRKYRGNLLAEIERLGIRALGDKYDRAKMTTTLATQDVAGLEAYRDTFAQMAEHALPGGRATVDGQQANAPADARADATPDWAYRA